LKIAIAGGCRFIAFETARVLAGAGHEVAIVDERSCPGEPPASARVYRAWPGGPPREALDGARVLYVFHEMDGVPQCLANPHTCWRENVEAHNSLIWAALEADVERIVYASTAAVYGDQQRLPAPEDSPTEPLSWYGATRLAGEALARGLARERGLDLVLLRFFNVYGPGQWNRGNPGVVHAMLVDALTRGLVRVEGDGVQTRDFVHAADAVRAAEAALKAPPGTYNIATGRETSILELAETIAEIHGEPLTLVWAQPRPGDISRSAGDPSRARRLMGWEPLIPLREGLKRLYRDYRASLARA